MLLNLTPVTPRSGNKGMAYLNDAPLYQQSLTLNVMEIFVFVSIILFFSILFGCAVKLSKKKPTVDWKNVPSVENQGLK